MSKIIILQGLPASGKSTKAEEITKNGNTVRLNKDLVRTMLHFDKFSGNNEGMTRLAVRCLAKEFLLRGKSVIIDDTNLNPGTKQSWVDLGKEVGSKIEHIILNTSVEECIIRDSARKKSVGQNVIIKMALQHLEYMKGAKVVICDLDGTLCDISHRLHHAKGEKKNWKEFFDGISGDKIREDVKEKLDKYLEDGYKYIFVSARPEDYREVTEQWISAHYRNDYSALLMRESGDKRQDTEVKSQIHEKYLKNLDIIKVFDDRPSVIRMWREKGLDVEDVGQGIEF